MPAPTIDEPPALPVFPRRKGEPDQPATFFPKMLAFLAWFTTFRVYLIQLIAYLEGLGGSGVSGTGFTPVTVYDTTYTLSAENMNQHLRFVSPDEITVVVPPEAGFTEGVSVRFTQAGGGTIRLVEGEGVTVNWLDGRATEGRFAVFDLEYVGSEEWDAFGDLGGDPRPDWLTEDDYGGIDFTAGEAGEAWFEDERVLYTDLSLLLTEETADASGPYDPARLTAEGYDFGDFSDNYWLQWGSNIPARVRSLAWSARIDFKPNPSDFYQIALFGAAEIDESESSNGGVTMFHDGGSGDTAFYVADDVGGDTTQYMEPLTHNVAYVLTTSNNAEGWRSCLNSGPSVLDPAQTTGISANRVWIGYSSRPHRWNGTIERIIFRPNEQDEEALQEWGGLTYPPPEVVSSYDDEDAQDAIGSILVDSSTIDLTYSDATPSITASVKTGSIGPTELAATAVTPGSYTNADITVDADGRITAAANGSGGGSYTDEQAQDAVGTILTDSSHIDFTYNDGAPSITASIVAGSVGATELAATTVTPGSYTSADITVDADGRITAAANGSGGGGGSGALVVIEQYVANGSAGSKAFTSIPNTYTDLEIRISGRGTNSSLQNVGVTVNSLGASGYDMQRMHATNTALVGDQALAQASWANAFALPGTAATAGFVSGGEMVIQDYAGTTFHKLMRFHARHLNSTTTGSGYDVHGSGVARTTSAISSVTLTLAAGNFDTGTVITLYGRD